MNDKFNKNAKDEKFTNMLGIAVCRIAIDPLPKIVKKMEKTTVTDVYKGAVFCV